MNNANDSNAMVIINKHVIIIILIIIQLILMIMMIILLILIMIMIMIMIIIIMIMMMIIIIIIIMIIASGVAERVQNAGRPAACGVGRFGRLQECHPIL